MTGMNTSYVRRLSPPVRMNSGTDVQENVAAPLDELHHGDPTMQANAHAARRVAERDVAILLCGETGTGKELFAKAIHQTGSRARKPFVAINCASIPETLIESELFGYKSGAFTGASREGLRGKLFQANGGTLFLDEIGDMPMPLQARLLRVLEEREVLPLGSETPVKIDIRVISATHCDLLQKIEAHEFRADLFYRLNGLRLALPPLRERADKRALIEHVLERESEGSEIGIDEDLMTVFLRYSWPGNLRELRNTLRAMVALRNGSVLGIADLPAGFAVDRVLTASGGQELNALENAERDALLQELAQHHWNISNVAKKLKVSRNTLYRKLRRLHIREEDKTARR